MRSYIIKRVLLAFPTLLAITLITYVIMRLAPGDPTRTDFLSGGSGTLRAGKEETAVARILREKYYLDRNPIVGYGLWLRDLVTGRGFGTSITFSRGTSVTQIILGRLPVTLTLNLLSLAVVYLLAIPLGVLSAVRRNRFDERLTTLLLFLLWSIPVIWAGPQLMALFGYRLGWLPVFGISPGKTYAATHSAGAVLFKTASYYVLPVLCLSYAGLAGLSRYMRVGLLEVLRQDYVRTARAKGLPERTVVLKHALRNGLIPLITLLAGLLPSLIAGSVIVEHIFSIPGMGQLALDALFCRDYPLIMAEVFFGTVLMLLGILLSDLGYALADPRISYG